MKTEVEQQAQNEVKDMLHEYVVAPLRGEILPALEQMTTSIEGMENSTKEKIEEASRKNNRDVNNLQTKLDYSFHFDDEEDRFDDVNNSIVNERKEIIKKIDKTATQMQDTLGDLKSEIEELQGQSLLKQEQVKSDLLEENSKYRDRIVECIGELGTKSEKAHAAIIAEIGALGQVLDSDFKESDEAVKAAEENLKQLISENESSLEKALCGQQANLIREIKDLQERLDMVRKSISDGIEGSAQRSELVKGETQTVIKEAEQDLKTSYEKHFKILLYVCLSFGIIDFVGIAAVLLLYFIR